MPQYYPTSQQPRSKNDLMAALLDGMQQPVAPPVQNGGYQLQRNPNTQLPGQTQNYIDMILSLVNSGGAVMGNGRSPVSR